MNESNHQACSFTINGHLYGLNILDIKEVYSDLKFHRIFHANHFIKGYVNVRGQINLILNLRHMLGYQDHQDPSQAKVILFKNKISNCCGIIVDNIGEIINLRDIPIDQPSSDDFKTGDKNSRELVSGVAKLRESVMVLLASQKIIDFAEKPNLGEKNEDK